MKIGDRFAHLLEQPGLNFTFDKHPVNTRIGRETINLPNAAGENNLSGNRLPEGAREQERAALPQRKLYKSRVILVLNPKEKGLRKYVDSF
jgi:hypothetical protein